VEAVNGQLVESHPDGSTKVLKTLARPTPVAVGQRRVRVRRWIQPPLACECLPAPTGRAKVPSS